MPFFSGLLVLATLTAFADAGVLSLHTLDVCRDCDSPSPQSFKCNMRVAEPVVLIIDCPVESLFTGRTLLVMGKENIVSEEALLMSRTLTCDDVGDVKMLNGRDIQTTTTQNQTTGGWLWPIPGVPEEDEKEDDEVTTTSEKTTTSQITVTGSTETTTHFIAFTVAVHVNWTIVTVTMAVSVTSVGVFVAVHVCLPAARTGTDSEFIETIRAGIIPTTLSFETFQW